MEETVIHEVVVNVRNQTGAFEAISREPWDGTPLADVTVSAEDIGGPVGQELRIDIQDEFGNVVDAINTESK